MFNWRRLLMAGTAALVGCGFGLGEAEAEQCSPAEAVKAMAEIGSLANACIAEWERGSAGSACSKYEELDPKAWASCGEMAADRASRAAESNKQAFEAERQLAGFWLEAFRWRVDVEGRVLYARLKSAGYE